MKIYELHATTGNSALIISVRGTYVDERGYQILATKAVETYRKKVQAQPRFVEFPLRLAIFERETDKDGIFRNKRTIYRDYGFERGDIKNNIVLIEEKHFNR